ncbi:hypothetical protein ACPPVV_00545 [Rhodanobacter sp. Col0626]|uniref:hypothetical protein n=1 Tax=Rhodanobacter sp. Col0626 TaxID=3415679 RepID=UPI003CF12612
MAPLMTAGQAAKAEVAKSGYSLNQRTAAYLQGSWSQAEVKSFALNELSGPIPRCSMQIVLGTLGPSHTGSANGDESYANTAEGDLFSEVCSDDEHATRRDEKIAAALCILWI